MFRRTSPPREPARARSASARGEERDSSLGGRLRELVGAIRSTFGRQPLLARRIIVGTAVGIFVLVAAFALAVGPLVRRRLANEAARRHLDLDVGSVRPGFFAVSLKDVRVKPQDGPGLELVLEEARVDLGASFAVQGVTVRGGRLTVEGEVDEVSERIRRLRGRSDDTPERSSGGSQRSFSVENVAMAWKFPSGGELAGTGLRARREGSAIVLGCGKCTGHHHERSIEVVDAEVELESGAIRRIGAVSVHFEVSSPVAPPSVAPTPVAATAEPAPPPLPAASRKKGALPKAPAAETSDEPILPLPNLHALRAKIAAVASTLAPRIPDGARVDIRGLSAHFNLGGDPIAFGPGPLVVERRAERIHVAFSSGVGEGQPAAEGDRGKAPLSVDAELPLTKGDVTARLAGGPVSLAALGVKEGMRGLTDVSHGTISGKGQLVLSEAADALTFDGEIGLHAIAMKQQRLSPEPLRGIDFSMSGRGVLTDGGKLRLDDGQLDMGALHLRTHGTVEEASDHFGVSLAIDVLPAACQALLDSAPQGLLPLVRSARMNGTFAASLNLAFDTRAIDKLSLDYRIGDECRIVEVPPDLSRDRFADAFTYRTYRPDGTVGEATTGPGTTNWTALDDISPFMISALLTTEDGAFYKHKGFNHAAIRSSIQANLKARRFVRGASTITMQLAKNLFLTREKALSRKIEEVVLTDYLEQVFRKDDMMELYLNVVEFGPDVYGITQAAAYYFGRKPEELEVGECFFLASLLPSPIRYGKLREKGAVSEGWMRHLHALMQIAEKNGKITHAELEEGLKAPIAFVRDGDPPPTPRKPVTSTRRGPGDDEDAWRPLD